MDFDVVISGGVVVTAADTFRCDVGITAGRIACLGEKLSGKRVINANGLLVLPGGVDSHCHIEQLEPDGSLHEETFETASRSAFLGGTTTVICFSPQFKGSPIKPGLERYRALAARSSVDYSFHQIITDPTDDVLERELPEIVASGIRSFKAFLTYDPLRLDDAQFLRVLAAARKLGVLVAVHCENYDAIAWRSEMLLAAGLSAPGYHAWSRPVVVEREATYRAIALAELVDQPIQIFHVSSPEVAVEIARAKRRGLKVWAETCPQYLVLDASDMDRPGSEGAKFICSPSPRDSNARAGLWNDIRAGTVDVVSSDHCGYSFSSSEGKQINGPNAPFNQIPNGIPGLATRLTLLFTEGVVAGHIDLNAFVRLTSAAPAKLFGLYPKKGTIAPGSDADLVLWDASAQGVITNSALGHAIDYTPYEARRTVGKPVMTLSRGEVVMDRGVVEAAAGRGRFLAREAYDFIKPTGRTPNGFNA